MLFNAAVDGREAEVPFADRLTVFQIPVPVHELHKMTVSGCGESAVAFQKIHFHTVSVCKCIPLPRIRRSIFVVSALIIAVHEFGHERKQVYIAVAGFRDPRKMVDSRSVRIDVPPAGFDAGQLFQHAAQELLRMEDLVTAADCFDFREHTIEGLDADTHRVRQVEHPGFRTVIANRLREFLVCRNRPQRTQDAARSYRVPHRLQDPVFFRGMYI